MSIWDMKLRWINLLSIAAIIIMTIAAIIKANNGEWFWMSIYIIIGLFNLGVLIYSIRLQNMRG